ncbi:MAG: hypothetical protein SO471_15810 [Anaerobutyricum hallii]|uniref:hypothetical protein n=1 Tax=Anaerobutyricum hallii TaxID=39488 RepID=UPI002A7F323C|nr:hypothetical protein [Anaerobutyricum hallii]MDY4579380.1 hypothetical protein [Anaerobutyricum hallii]
MITEENKFLGLEEIKNLIEKVYAAQQAGNYVVFTYDNYSVRATAMKGKVSENKEWEKKFEMETYACDPMQEYNDCIAYLEKLAFDKTQ